MKKYIRNIYVKIHEIYFSKKLYKAENIIFTAFWSKLLDFFYNWYIDSVCEDKALHQVRRQNVN